MISLIAIVIGLLGCALVPLLYLGIQPLRHQQKLRQHRATGPGFADLLQYAAVVDDGIIVGKDGSLSAAFSYRGSDNQSTTHQHRAVLSARINQALSGLGNGWMVHVDAIRRSVTGYPCAEQSHFTDSISALVDEERRQLFLSKGNLHETDFVITFTWFPPHLIQNRVTECLFEDDAKAPDARQRTQALITQFTRAITKIEDGLSSALTLTRLKSQVIDQGDDTVSHDHFLAFLNTCITGKDHPIVLPKNPVYLDTILGSQELWGGVVPKIGEHFIQVVAIEGLPMESSPGLLAALAQLPCEYRWSSRFIFTDQHEAVAMLEKFRRKWKQKVRGFMDQVFNTASGRINQDALTMVQDADDAIQEVSAGSVAMGYYTSVVVLMDTDRNRLAESARFMHRAINQGGFTARIETLNTLDAYFGSLPGHGVENVRRPLINTLNLADLLPTSSIWAGSATCPCPLYPKNAPPLMRVVTEGGTPFNFNLHVRDLGHTLVFGPTRKGKSVLLAFIALQARRYAGMTVFNFDKGMSMYATTKAVGGLHFSVADDDDRLAFCPLQFLDTESDRAWALSWVETLLALNECSITPEQRNKIAETLLSMHKNGSKRLSEFNITIQDTDIREALAQYTAGGVMGNLLDAESDGLTLSGNDFFTFELEALMNLQEKYALPVLLYLFRRIEKRLEGQPALIQLDEAWMMLDHPAFREKIRDWLKAFAKKNCALLMATQNLSDASNSGIFDVLVESTASKILLPNENAGNQDAAALYRNMGLDNEEIDLLVKAKPKCQYYYRSESGRRLIELNLGPFALAFVGAGDKDSIARIQELDATCEDWRVDWLTRCGVNPQPYLEFNHV